MANICDQVRLLVVVQWHETSLEEEGQWGLGRGNIGGCHGFGCLGVGERDIVGE